MSEVELNVFKNPVSLGSTKNLKICVTTQVNLYCKGSRDMFGRVIYNSFDQVAHSSSTAGMQACRISDLKQYVSSSFVHDGTEFKLK